MGRNGRFYNLKMEIAGELVPQIGLSSASNPGKQLSAGRPLYSGSDWDQVKFEIARELGVPLQLGYNGGLTAREAGRLGGKIGGNMVRRLVAIAEQTLANQNL